MQIKFWRGKLFEEYYLVYEMHEKSTLNLFTQMLPKNILENNLDISSIPNCCLATRNSSKTTKLQIQNPPKYFFSSSLCVNVPAAQRTQIFEFVEGTVYFQEVVTHFI